MNFTSTISEDYLLGAILIDPENSIMKLRGEGVTSATFTLPDNKKLWNYTKQLYDNGKVGTIELIEFEPEVIGDNGHDSLARKVSELRKVTLGTAHLDQHIATLKQYEATRMTYRASREAIAMIESGDEPEVVISKIQAKLIDATATMTSAKPWKDTKEIASEMVEIVRVSQNPDLRLGFATGLEHLDYHTGGMEDEQLWVVAAPPSCGKTLLMLQIVNAYLRASKHVLAFSFETGAGKLSLRNMSNNMEISANALNGKQGEKMTLNDNKRFKRGLDDMIAKDNLTVCDDYDMTLEKMQAIAGMRKKMGFQIDLIMVDYIQLVTLSDNQGKNREQQVAEISRTLKKMAKQHHCPVITASQLNNEGKTRESNAILQDADVLLNIDPKSECIYLAKNRDGERGEALPYVMAGKYQRFIDKNKVI